MKNLFKTLVVALLFLPALAIGQAAFDKLEATEDIGTVTISKGMLGIVASISADKQDEETKDFLELAKGLHEIKIYVSENQSSSKLMANTAKSYIRSSKLESLMKIKDGGSQVNFYVKEGKDSDHVSEMVMLVTDMDKMAKKGQFETVLLTMTGDIDLTKIGALVNKMNLPKDLEKAEKG